MNTLGIVLLVIAIVLVVAMVVLYFLGKRKQDMQSTNQNNTTDNWTTPRGRLAATIGGGRLISPERKSFARSCATDTEGRISRLEHSRLHVAL